MPQGRPAIPVEVKRAIRQQCGYGCAFCGKPLYTYEHILPWAEVQRHRSEDMTLLCDSHQRESSNGLLTQAQIRRANDEPFNIAKGVTAPYGLHFDASGPMTIRLGGDEFTWSGPLLAPLVVDNQPLLAFHREEDRLELYMYMRDEYNRPVLVVEANELALSTDAWDITFEGRTLIVRSVENEIFASIVFAPPSRIVIQGARFLSNGVEINVEDGRVSTPDGQIQASNNYWSSPTGLVFGYSPDFPSVSAIVGPRHVNRYLRIE